MSRGDDEEPDALDSCSFDFRKGVLSSCRTVRSCVEDAEGVPVPARSPGAAVTSSSGMPPRTTSSASLASGAFSIECVSSFILAFQETRRFRRRFRVVSGDAYGAGRTQCVPVARHGMASQHKHAKKAGFQHVKIHSYLKSKSTRTPRHA